MQHKSFEILETKADGETGRFEALVSVFNNIDHVGDRILPGAFTKTLEQWRSTGDPIPVILSHQWENPMAHVGVADPKNVKQTPRGLVVKGTLDVKDNEVAKQVYRLMKRRSLKAFSFGYTVPEGGQVLAEDGANDVTQIDLVEVGPTLKGANPEAQLQAVKSALQETEEREPPRDEETLRKEAERIVRERLAKGLPPVPEESPEEPPQEEETTEPPPPPRDESTLRKEAEKVVRERLAKGLPAGEPSPEGEEAVRELLAEVIQEKVEAAVARLKTTETSSSRDETTLRRQTDRLERELINEHIPEVKQVPPASTEPGSILEAAIAKCQEYVDAGADSGDVVREVIATLKQLPGESTECLYVRRVSQDEYEGTKSGEIKAVWNTAYVNNLPDSAFLYVEPGGSKDSEGKTTPRSLRHFPYKNASGAVDLPHLRNALARIPQSNLSQAVKDKLTNQAQRILDSQKSEPGPEPSRASPPDELRKRSDETVLEIQSDGVSLRKSPKQRQKHEPEPDPSPQEAELRRRSRDVMLNLLTGVSND